MRADWTASGACISGSTAPPRGVTRRASGGAATTNTSRFLIRPDRVATRRRRTREQYFSAYEGEKKVARAKICPRTMRRIAMFINEGDGWPRFHWDQDGLANQLATVRHRQGRLIGRMEGLGFRLREEAVLSTLAQDVLKSSEIEG